MSISFTFINYSRCKQTKKIANKVIKQDTHMYKLAVNIITYHSNLVTAY